MIKVYVKQDVHINIITDYSHEIMNYVILLLFPCVVLLVLAPSKSTVRMLAFRT